MSRYITTKADFTLRRKHKKRGETTIYENDYTTINPLPNALKGEYVIGDSNFVFTSSLGINAQNKHVRGKFVPNPSGSTDERGAWTMDTIIDSGITEETRIRLKPDYSSLRDFACYGSAVKLIQGTVNGVITDFPAEMYLSDETATIYKAENGVGYSFDSEEESAMTGYILYNEYDIDITTTNVQPESVYNPLRYFTLCGSSYTYIDKSGLEHELSGFSVTPTSSGVCFDGKEIWIDQLAEVKLTFNDDIEVIVKIFKNYDDNSMFYLYTGGEADCHIRPKKKIVEDYFRDCDDFTAVLPNRDIKPLYTANFETPIQTDTGIKYEMRPYTWPSLCGGFNPDLNGPYSSYLSSLIAAAEFYDEVFTDNMWRSLTHEAIKTLDWTYVSNTDGDTEDMGLFGKLGLRGNSEARKEAKDLGKPTVTCIVAGRNVLIDKRLYDDWDSVVMCYLPGSEGKGISDVLCGCSDFTGKLPSPWYGSLDQIRTDECWLERGYGLSYGDGFKPVDEPETILDPPTVVEPDPAIEGTNYTAGLFKDGVYVSQYAGIKLNAPSGLIYYTVDYDEKKEWIEEETNEMYAKILESQVYDACFANAKEAIFVFFVNTNILFPDVEDVTEDQCLDYCREWIDGILDVEWQERADVKLGNQEFSRDVCTYDENSSDYYYMKKIDNDMMCWVYVTTSEQGRTPEYYESLFEDIK